MFICRNTEGCIYQRIVGNPDNAILASFQVSFTRGWAWNFWKVLWFYCSR